MSDFEVIPDEERRKAPQRGPMPSPANLALRDGKTLFVPLNGKAPTVLQAGHRRHLNNHGFTLRYRQVERDGVKGIVMWAEPKDGAS